MKMISSAVSDSTINITEGFYEINQHFETPKHMSNISHKKDENELLLSSSMI